MSSATEEMGLDDIKKADEVKCEVISSPSPGGGGQSSPNPIITAEADTGKSASASKARPNKFFGGLSVSPNSRKKPKPQRQYSNMFPCPMIRSVDLDSPEGSVSSLGLVNSAPFASLAMTSVHARRARRAYSSTRTSSVQSGCFGVSDNLDTILRKWSGQCQAVGHTATYKL